MGVSESPDIAQEFIENLLQDLLEEIVVYIDDILVKNHSWSSNPHLQDVPKPCRVNVSVSSMNDLSQECHQCMIRFPPKNG